MARIVKSADQRKPPCSPGLRESLNLTPDPACCSLLELNCDLTTSQAPQFCPETLLFPSHAAKGELGLSPSSGLYLRPWGQQSPVLGGAGELGSGSLDPGRGVVWGMGWETDPVVAMTLSRGSRAGCLGLWQGPASGTYTKTAYSVWFLGTQLPSASPEGCLCAGLLAPGFGFSGPPGLKGMGCTQDPASLETTL